MNGQIIIYDHYVRYSKEKFIVLYSHNKGQELFSVLEKTLSTKEHWDDFDYFNRLLMKYMVEDDDGYWGYGISLTKKIDCKTYEIDFEGRRVWTTDEDEKIQEYDFDFFIS